MPVRAKKTKQTLREYAQKNTSQRKNVYGMEPGDVIKLWEYQGGACPLCGRRLLEAKPNIDHDHDTGAVRGILCSKCNTRLHEDSGFDWYFSVLLYITEKQDDVRGAEPWRN